MKFNLTPVETEKKIIKILKERKYRITMIRSIIIKIITKTRHFTIKYVINEVNRILKQKKVNIMSVYNVMNLLTDEHILFANVFNGKDIVYELILEHTIHAVCEKCLRIIHIDIFDKKVLYNDVISDKLKEYDWMPSIHCKLEVHSICPKCQKK